MLAIIVVLAFFGGCQSKADDNAFKAGPSEIARAIQGIVPAAVGVDAGAFSAQLKGMTAPKRAALAGWPPTAVVLVGHESESLDPSARERYARWFDDFQISGECKPRELIVHVQQTAHLGYCTMILPGDITNVTADVRGDVARGTIAFRAPNLYEGQLHYVAQRRQNDWEIVQFEFPGRGWKYIRTKEGKWEWHTAYGRPGDVMDGSQVSVWPIA